MEYKDFIEGKKKTIIKSGFEATKLNSNLFDFQKHIVTIALRHGKFAIFADCGLGKTLMQLSWSEAVYNHTNKKVLVLAPLAVVEQTKREALKFGISLDSFDITNYEQLKNIDVSIYSGVVLDESSILKGRDGKMSKLIIDTFKGTPYKLACTATPSPNDHMELGQHVEFLGLDSYDNMKSMFFVQDHKLKSSDKWRLRKHAKDDFWKYVCQWSIALDNPKTLGFHVEGYNLPQIEFIEHTIKLPKKDTNLGLFVDNAVSATDLHKDLKRSLNDRIQKTKEIIDLLPSDEQCIIWTLKNDEATLLQKTIEGSINVQGSDKPQVKADNLNGFAKKEFKNLITKTSIASFGMNYQQCSNMIFTSYDFKFEAFYQAVRRCYRFGQKNKVTVHLLVPESQLNVRKSILEKEKKHKIMISEMSKYSADTDYTTNKSKVKIMKKEIKTDNYHLINGDCVEEIKNIPTESIDYSFFSPPFSDLYTYSDDPKDLSNVSSDDEFYKHFEYLVPELYRVIKKGRLVSMHIMQGTTSIGKDGFLSIKDFRGDLIRLFQKHGFLFHAEKMIRKNPQLAAVRTKNSQLMHGQTKRDSSINRPGLADYIVTFRKKGKNETPIKNNIPFEKWCEMAEPVWMDIQEGDVVSNFRKGKDLNDEKHMTPTQLSVIERCIMLWSMKGETVFSPFGGAGSEGYQAVKMGRKSINIELKESYFELNRQNHEQAVRENMQTSLF